MIECPNIDQKVIQNHYDVSTFFYRLFWGPHIHHGYWDADESPSVAQLQLTQRLAKLASIKPGSTVVDIGCGMGGSSIWLAKNLDCDVTGVTLSPFQRRWAAVSSKLKGVGSRTQFLCMDAEKYAREAGSTDVVWSIECTEHLYEKPAFFRKAAAWIRPGGHMAICAWLAGHDEDSADTVAQVKRVCEGMFCPSLGTQKDYADWLQQGGMRLVENQLWTKKVLKTWEICKSRVDRSGVRILARLLGENHTLFLNRFDAILNAYKSGAMEYGCLVAVKE